MSAKIHAISGFAGQSEFLTPNLDYLKELSGGDRNFITEILELFITEAPQSVEQSFRYLREMNLEMLRINVHKLKSSVQVVGGYHLTYLIQEIESAAKEHRSQNVLHQMLSVLNKGIQHLVEHLGKELQNISSAGSTAA